MGILRSDRVSGLGGANAINGSVKFSYEQDALIVPPSPDFNLGTEDYTIEAWVYPEQEGASLMIYAVGDSDSTAKMGKFYYRSTKKFTYWCQSSVQITSSGTFDMGSWYHVALVNSSGTQTLYVNGVSQGTSTYSGFGGDAFLVEVGKNPSNAGQSMNGYISNLRVQKGKAEYTAAFTPPTTRLEKTPETVLLCCQSPSDVIQEATGKSLVIGKASGADSGPVAARFVPDKGEDHGTTFADNTKFDTLSYMVPPGGRTDQRGRGRGFRFGGDSPTKANHIEYVNIQSQGTAQDFGDLLTTLTQAHGGSSSIRTIIFAGYNAPANVADIQYFTNATQGNSIDAGIDVGGDFTRYCNVVSSETRSVYGGGTPGYTATMEYVTNASLGSVTDFADFVQGGMYSAGTMNSTTRGLFAGGYYASPVGQSTRIQYITIATTADSIAFGDLTQVMGGPHGICSSPTRGIMWDGGNTIDYVTIATLGDGVDFGEASVDGFNSGVSFSSHTRACAGGGYNQDSPGSGGNSNQNYIDFVQIATTGNAKDFGDLRTDGSSMGGSSDCHGGLS